MFENIRAYYITKLVFSFVDIKTTSKLIRYNKSIQSKININPLYIKLLSDRYIIYETNGKAYEYRTFDDSLLFKGKYLNGKRNGKGKEFYENTNEKKYLFNGERYITNRFRKKIVFFKKDKVRFKGEFFNGKKMEKEKNIMKMVN